MFISKYIVIIQDADGYDSGHADIYEFDDLQHAQECASDHADSSELVYVTKTIGMSQRTMVYDLPVTP